MACYDRGDGRTNPVLLIDDVAGNDVCCTGNVGVLDIDFGDDENDE